MLVPSRGTSPAVLSSSCLQGSEAPDVTAVAWFPVGVGQPLAVWEAVMAALQARWTEGAPLA